MLNITQNIQYFGGMYAEVLESRIFKPENYKNVDIKFTLRLPEELHQDIASYSNKHNISMNTLILNCIEYAMANREEEDK